MQWFALISLAYAHVSGSESQPDAFAVTEQKNLCTAFACGIAYLQQVALGVLCEHILLE